MKACPFCAADLEDESTLCTDCGGDLSAIPPPAAPSLLRRVIAAVMLAVFLAVLVTRLMLWFK